MKKLLITAALLLSINANAKVTPQITLVKAEQSEKNIQHLELIDIKRYYPLVNNCVNFVSSVNGSDYGISISVMDRLLLDLKEYNNLMERTLLKAEIDYSKNKIFYDNNSEANKLQRCFSLMGDISRKEEPYPKPSKKNEDLKVNIDKSNAEIYFKTFYKCLNNTAIIKVLFKDDSEKIKRVDYIGDIYNKLLNMLKYKIPENIQEQIIQDNEDYFIQLIKDNKKAVQFLKNYESETNKCLIDVENFIENYVTKK